MCTSEREVRARAKGGVLKDEEEDIEVEVRRMIQRSR